MPLPWSPNAENAESRSTIERDLVFGVLCLDQEGCSRDDVSRSLAEWAANPSISLRERLLDKSLNVHQLAMVEVRMNETLHRCGGDTRLALRNLSSAGHFPPPFSDLLDATLTAQCIADNGDTSETACFRAVAEIEGRYENKGERGRGGLGRVLVVRDHFLGRDVALKELLDSEGDSSASTLCRDAVAPSGAALLRFLQEARITSQLEHPSIIPVYELGQRADGRPYYTMKLVRGQTLDRAIEEATTLAERLELLPHFIDVCQAVAFAHSRGVIHRDIKPQNIMVGAFGETALVDWGLAKLKGDDSFVQKGASVTGAALGHASMSMLGQVLGTPAYMAPEQACGDSTSIGERTDVYALGAVLYALLCGRRPFSGSNAEEILERVVQEPPEPVERIVEHLPSELAAICAKAMAKEPTLRYASAAELAEEIQRFQTGAMVQAYIYTRRERIVRFVRRNRAVLAVAVTALVVLSVGAALALGRILDETAKTHYELYAASISLAQNALERQLCPEPREALAKAPEACRNWEWGYLACLARPEVLVLYGHTKPLRHGIFSADGKRILTGAFDATVKLWDTSTGREIRTFTGLPETARRPSLSTDAMRAAAACARGVALVWDVPTGQTICQIHETPPSLHSSVLSPDGHSLATWGAAPVFKLWSVDTSTLVREFQGHTGSSISQVVFSHDGRFLASCGQDQTARLWNVETGALLNTFPGHSGRISGVALAPDASRLATADGDGTVRLYDATSGATLQTFTGHTAAYVTFVEFAPDGRHLVSASEDQTVRLWDMATGKEIQRVEGLFKAAQLLSVHPDGLRFLTAGADNTACVRTLAPRDTWRTLRGHTAPVNDVAFSPDGATVGTVGGHWEHGGDDRAILWDANTGQERLTLRGHQGSVNGIAFLPDNRRVLTVGSDATLRLWDIRNGQSLDVWKEHTDQARCVAVSPDGTCAITGGWDKSARLWDIEHGHVTAVLEHADLVDRVAFSPVGGIAATACRDGKAHLWDTTNAMPIREFPCSEGWAWGLAFSPDGSRLALGGGDGGTLILDTSTGACIHKLRGHTNRVQAAVFSRDGRRLFTGSLDKRIKVWDTETGRELLSLALHGDRLGSLAIASDGLTLASAGDDAVAVLSPAFPWRTEDLPGTSNESFEYRMTRYHTDYWTGRFPELAATGAFNP